MEELITVSHVAIVAVVTGLVQVAKFTGLPSKYAPVITLILAVGIEFVYFRQSLGLANSLFAGLVVGLSSSGFYSWAKTVSKPDEEIPFK